MISVGSVVVKLAGRDAGKAGVVIKTEGTQLLLDGQVRRRAVNAGHVEATGQSVDVKEGADHATIRKALEGLGYAFPEEKKATKERKEKGAKPVKQRKSAQKAPKKTAKKTQKSEKKAEKTPAKESDKKDSKPKKADSKDDSKKESSKKTSSSKKSEKASDKDSKSE